MPILQTWEKLNHKKKLHSCNIKVFILTADKLRNHNKQSMQDTASQTAITEVRHSAYLYFWYCCIPLLCF